MARAAVKPKKAVTKKRSAPKKPAVPSGAQALHSIHTGQVLEQSVEGHPARTDSAEFVRARTTLHKILPDIFGGINPWGPGPVQAHHGGSILVYDGTMWRVVLNWAGIEWSEQFAADPAKVELLRQNAEAIIGAFPQTEPQLAALGYTDCDILHTPVTDQDSIGRYVDSIFNSCVPIPQPAHTGSVSTKTPRAAGVHNYPLPACDMPMFVRDDFVPFVVDPATKAVVAVAPVAPRGSGDARVRVLYVAPGHPLLKPHVKASMLGKALVLDPGNPIAKKAFGKQR